MNKWIKEKIRIETWKKERKKERKIERKKERKNIWYRQKSIFKES